MGARRADRGREIGFSERASGGATGHGPLPKGPVKAGAAAPSRRGFRVLLAHDFRATTCDGLVVAIEAALDDVELVDASSVDDARAAVATELFDACLICLDLPPAPLGGARLADELLSDGHPVVLVTRSLRWLPADRPALRDVPWIAPDASEADVTQAVAQAASAFDSMIRVRAPLRGEADVALDEWLAAGNRG